MPPKQSSTKSIGKKSYIKFSSKIKINEIDVAHFHENYDASVIILI